MTGIVCDLQAPHPFVKFTGTNLWNHEAAIHGIHYSSSGLPSSINCFLDSMAWHGVPLLKFLKRAPMRISFPVFYMHGFETTSGANLHIIQAFSLPHFRTTYHKNSPGFGFERHQLPQATSPPLFIFYSSYFSSQDWTTSPGFHFSSSLGCFQCPTHDMHF